MVRSPGHLTEQEILAQPRLWAAALEESERRAPSLRRLWRTVSPDLLLLTGCGSSYYLAVAAAAMLQSVLKVPCRALPSSEILFTPDDAFLSTRAPLVIAISRSGETTETISALKTVKQRRAATLALTCRRDGTLSRAADLALELPVEEQSVVMTSSFTAMLLSLVALGADLAEDTGLAEDARRTPAIGAGEISGLANSAAALASDAPRPYVFLGSGPQFGLACEGALKMTEMALLPAPAYHTLEFLHGPKAAVSAETVVVGLLSQVGQPYERQVLQHVAGLGARTVVLGGVPGGLTAVDLRAPAGTVPAMILATVWMQLLALSVAQARGVNPDAPQFLQSVVTWDGSRILTEGR